MAVLTTQQRAEVRAEFSRDETTTFGSLTKADLLAAVDALDNFFDANITAINNALPTTAKNTLTAAQKSRLIRYVIAKRYG